MRITLRLIVSLILVVALGALSFAYFQVRAEKRALRRELERRAEVLAASLAHSANLLLEKGSRKELQSLVDRFGNGDRLAGVVVYDREGQPLARTSGFAAHLATPPEAVLLATKQNKGEGEFVQIGSTPMHVYAVPLTRDDHADGTLAVFHDASFIDTRGARLWRDTFKRVLVEALFIVLATILLIRWSITGPIAKTAQWMRELRTGRRVGHSTPPRRICSAP